MTRVRRPTPGDTITASSSGPPGHPDAAAEAGTPVSAELRRAARGGALTLVGSTFSTAMGFLLVIVLASQLGAAGSGVVLQTIAAFMIALSLARLGMDTTAVWIIPRLREESPSLVRGACVGTLTLAAAAAAVVVAGWWAVRWAAVLTGRPTTVVGDLISAVSWALPLAAVMLVALAATRGFGGVRPFNLIGNVAMPASRPIGVLTVTLLGGSVLSAALAWAVPLLPAAAAGVWVLHRQVAAFERKHGVSGAWLPTRAVQRRLLGFALPRTLSAGLEQSIIWFDVVLVGILAGSAAAGIYGAASRFVGAGIVVITALRIVVAPRFSAYLAQGRRDEVQQLYTVTAGWILLFGTPVYVLLAFFASTVLGWLGPEFQAGVPALVVLCLGALALLAGGNVQSLLLMSGRSGWGAVNKAVVFTVNVVGNLALIPQLGFLGAAVTWACCMALDTTLAVLQVYRFTRVSPSLGRITVIVLAAGSCASLASLLALRLVGDGALGLVTAALGTGVLVIGYGLVDRRRLHLDDLLAMIPSRRGGGRPGG